MPGADLVRPLTRMEHQRNFGLFEHLLSTCFHKPFQFLSDKIQSDLIQFIHTTNSHMSFFRLLSEQSVTTF